MKFLAGRSWLTFLWVLVAAATLAWGLSVGVSIASVGRPFPGFLFETNLVVSSLRVPEWNGPRAGLANFDRLLAADGQVLRTPADLDRLVASKPAGTPIAYRVWRQGGEVRITVATQRFGWSDYFRSTFEPHAGAALYLLIGIACFALRPGQRAVQAHLLFNLAAAVLQAGIAFYDVAHVGAGVIHGLSYFLASGILHLSLTFPTPRRWVRRWPPLEYLPHGLAALLGGYVVLHYRPVGQAADPAAVAFYFGHLGLWGLWTLAASALALGLLAKDCIRGPDAEFRRQARAVAIGASGTFSMIAIGFAVPFLLGRHSEISVIQVWLFYLGTLMFPLSVAFAVLRYRMFGMRVLRGTLVYGSLILGVEALYQVLSAVSFRAFGTASPAASQPSLSGFLTALAVAVAFRPLRDRLRRWVDALMGHRQLPSASILEGLGQVPAGSETAVASALANRAHTLLGAEWALCAVGECWSGVAGDVPEGVRVGDTADIGRFALYAPVAFGSGVKGTLGTGGRKDGLPFSTADAAVLEALAAQGEIAFENAWLFDERLAVRARERLARQLARDRAALVMQFVHDLRSDLFNIRIAAELAKADAADREALESIGRSLDRIDGLLTEQARRIASGA